MNERQDVPVSTDFNDAELDKSWISKLPFKFVSLFARLKRQIEADPWLDAFFELTKAAERIVADKNATPEDWKKAWNDAFDILKGKIDPDSEEDGDIFSDFVVFVSKFSIRQGWAYPTYEEITYKWEELGGTNMTFEINCIQDLARLRAWEDGRSSGLEDGERKGRQENLRETLKKCITLRFPRVTQATINNVLSIADVDVLNSIFNVACTADSLDSFQRDIRGFAPVN